MKVCNIHLPFTVNLQLFNCIVMISIIARNHLGIWDYKFSLFKRLNFFYRIAPRWWTNANEDIADKLAASESDFFRYVTSFSDKPFSHFILLCNLTTTETQKSLKIQIDYDKIFKLFLFVKILFLSFWIL